MPTTPTSLALTSIADNSQIIASSHRNNNSAIQTAVNALITIFSGGTAGQFFKSGGGTSVSYDYPPGYQYDYAQWTADVTTAATTEGTAATVVTSAAVTLDGSTAVWLEFWTPDTWNSGANSNIYTLWDGATPLGFSGLKCVAGTDMGEYRVRIKTTPSAAAHTFKATMHVTAGTGHSEAGAGGTGAKVPGYLTVTKV